MKIQTLTLVCFSPTGTTKAVAQGIAHGINQGHVELVDITKPDARTQQFQASDDELLVVAVPVYMGRVPALLTEWLLAICAQNTPAVCVVVYGNRAYDDALLDLRTLWPNVDVNRWPVRHLSENTPFLVPRRQQPKAVLMQETLSTQKNSGGR